MSEQKKVMVSLGVMCGDVHADKPLERCLRSVLEKAHGCPVDEIVIGFNGKDLDAIDATIKRLGYQQTTVQFIGDFEAAVEATKKDGTPPTTLSTWVSSTIYNRPPLKLVCFEWPGRFDTARNMYWPHLSGEWLLSIDADDVLNDGATEEGMKAIRDLERDYGLEPANVGTGEKPIGLQSWLSSLPPPINVILIGYDYEIDTNGYVLVRQKTKRLVKRSLGHIWQSPDESGIHELLTPVGATPENAITNLGILLRHLPSQTDAERAARNREVIDRLTKSDIPVEARHAYDTANLQVYAGDLTRGEQNLMVAIQQATNDLDRYTYRLAYASLKFQQGNPASALEVCAAAITLNPEFQEAYFLACEAAYRMGKWAAAVEWYERGLSKSPVLLSRDQPLMRFIQPRGQAADALLNMGNPEKAMKLAKECSERYPKSPLSIWVMERATNALRAQKLGDSLLDAVDALSEDAPSLAKNIILSLPSYEATRGLGKALRARALLTKLTVKPVRRPHIQLGDDLELEWDDKMSIEDALRECRAANYQLLKYEQLAPKKVKVSTGESRRPSVAFYSPMAVELWTPAHVETNGLGGSESSLAYLARELSKKGHPVEVYTPHPSGAGAVTLYSGEHRGEKFSVIQKDLTLMHEASKMDVLVTCRAPYLAREMREVWGKKPVFCWHQDNGYGNPWLWSKGVVEMQQHLHVSKWAMKGLLREGYTGVTADKPWESEWKAETYDAQALARHHVLGNGIPPECGEGWDKVTRNHKRVIYASDPSRGLEALLEVWPKVRAEVPDAELLIFSSFRVMASLKQDLPGLPVVKRIEGIRNRCKELEKDGVQLVGWQPQPVLLEAFKGAGIYCYPGGPMPEGFGVSLVQAKACGLEVMCPDLGALPDVLPRRTVLGERTGQGLADSLICSLRDPVDADVRREGADEVLGMHAWPAVAERFLSFVDGWKTLDVDFTDAQGIETHVSEYRTQER